MEMTAIDFEAKCLLVIDKVQKEKSRITITHHGEPVAELIPISSSAPGKWFGRSRNTTVILGDLLSPEQNWHTEDRKSDCCDF